MKSCAVPASAEPASFQPWQDRPPSLLRLASPPETGRSSRFPLTSLSMASLSIFFLVSFTRWQILIGRLRSRLWAGKTGRATVLTPAFKPLTANTNPCYSPPSPGLFCRLLHCLPASTPFSKKAEMFLICHSIYSAQHSKR